MKKNNSCYQKIFFILCVSMFIINEVKGQKYGLNCQYFPGLQFGSVKVSTNNPKLGNYSYGAGLPLLMIDRIAKWYFNIDMNATYYGATTTNKANDNQIKISKAEGGFFSGRIGYMFGKNYDKPRIGLNFNLGFSTSNLDSVIRPFSQRGYTNLGGGLIYYQSIGKMAVVAKVGYEKYAAKKYITQGSGFYFEGTVAYNFYQKFGLSVMPCFYSKNFTYTPKNDPNITTAKVTSFVLRIGITKFF
ncbi:MAG: hypothetical protein KatS3mg027_0842 [Bacteroidia bacterium]|nr:MAG: hypothetical protein KatS3mg027_0842 [Bacteroidia bacterium]